MQYKTEENSSVVAKLLQVKNIFKETLIPISCTFFSELVYKKSSVTKTWR